MWSTGYAVRVWLSCEWRSRVWVRYDGWCYACLGSYSVALHHRFEIRGTLIGCDVKIDKVTNFRLLDRWKCPLAVFPLVPSPKRIAFDSYPHTLSPLQCWYFGQKLFGIGCWNNELQSNSGQSRMWKPKTNSESCKHCSNRKSYAEFRLITVTAVFYAIGQTVPITTGCPTVLTPLWNYHCDIDHVFNGINAMFASIVVGFILRCYKNPRPHVVIQCDGAR